MNPFFLLGPLAIAAISAVLAAIISLIDLLVNNYGECRIDVNDGRKALTVRGGAPSACGGRGSCGVCKVKVLSDIGPILPTELPYLSEEEKAGGVRLSCQIKVKSDLKILVPEELFAIQRFDGIVESIRDMTHDIKELRIRLTEPGEIRFKAGQYAQLESRPYGNIKESAQRAYSMSSVPSETDHVEFFVRLVPGGILTTWVFEMLHENDPIRLVGPIGEFRMNETDACKICVAGGSGMAPLKSIILDMAERSLTDWPVWYFFGARTRKDLFYVEELEKLAAEWQNFHFVMSLSEPQPEDDWKGEVGLITDVLDRYLKEKVGEELPKEGYLCGSPGMIDACVRVMQSNGMPEERIYYDKFA